MLNKKNHRVSSKYRAAIIGCGGIGFFYDYEKNDSGLTHFSTLEQNSDFQLLAIADTKTATRDLIAGEYDKRVYADFDEMMRQESPLDIVAVATPDETHEEILISLLQYRSGLVFAEKPLAASGAAMKKIINLYDAAGIGLQVNFYRRFVAAFQQVKNIMDSGEIGRMQVITVYYSRGFYHNCCHFIDLITWYFG
ncbi:MAG: Gfo/Idh/MocA family oxidoreductase, partial [Desulfobulbaceae bacterium]|nr:Gfo/Idh/MocA family oxidoreductase [Desulfobulbaceae bacterium]